MSVFQELYAKHEQLKRYVHEGFRYPLPKWGRAVMGFVYFSIPVVAGWTIMQWAISKSHESIGENGEKLPVKTVLGIGDRRGHDGKLVGGEGWGGGVKLVVSDDETQKKNRLKLNKFLQSLKEQNNGSDSR